MQRGASVMTPQGHPARSRVEVHYGRKNKYPDQKIWAVIQTLIKIFGEGEEEFKVFQPGTMFKG